MFLFSSLKGANCNFSSVNLRAGWAGLILPCFFWIVGECVAGAFVALRYSVNCVRKVHMPFVIGVAGQCFLFGGMEVNDNIMDHGSIHNSECLRMEFVIVCDWPCLGFHGAGAFHVKAW